jgi:hypothetical protein
VARCSSRFRVGEWLFKDWIWRSAELTRGVAWEGEGHVIGLTRRVALVGRKLGDGTLCQHDESFEERYDWPLPWLSTVICSNTVRIRVR